MIDKIKNFLKKASQENLDTGMKFEEVEITIDEQKIKLNGEFNLEVTEK